MTKEEFTSLNNKYAPIVEEIISSNYRFYGLDETIKWGFTLTNTPSVLATCNRETNIIKIDINSFKEYFENDNLIEAEYFIIHEIRHIFQHIQIKKYKENKECELPNELIKKWVYEAEHYEMALDKNGNENPKYFNQDIELDAYAFSYAVIMYKYGIADVYVPPMYGQKFLEIVNKWINEFKAEKIFN